MSRHHRIACYDVFMRTTLTLEPDVAVKLKKRMAEQKLTLKDAINQALRVGLEESESKRKLFKVESYPLGIRPGIDPDKLNQLLDELDVEEYLRKSGR
jgi:hypothetical protein